MVQGFKRRLPFHILRLFVALPAIRVCNTVSNTQHHQFNEISMDLNLGKILRHSYCGFKVTYILSIIVSQAADGSVIILRYLVIADTSVIERHNDNDGGYHLN